MKKIEQKKLLLMSGVGEIAGGFIGIFFLFFVKENFGLNLWQTVTWFASMQILFGVMVYPLNAWGLRHLGVVRMIGLGLVFEALFFLILALEITSGLALFTLTLFFLLELAFFWPSYNFLIARATQDENRGNFLGDLRIIIILIGIIMPLLVGWLFDQGQQNKILWIALVFFVGTIYLSQKLSAPKEIRPIPWAQSYSHLKRIFLQKDRLWGFLPDITDAAMWSLWPLYFQWVVGKFVIMGAITSLVAVIEMISSKALGKLTDNKSAKSLLKTTVWSRVVDLCLRPIFIVFSPIWFVALVQSLGSLLGPIYQIPYQARIMEIGEELTTPDELFDYWVIREIYLGLGRGIFLLVCAELIYLFGAWIMGIIIAFAGLTALGARKL